MIKNINKRIPPMIHLFPVLLLFLLMIIPTVYADEAAGTSFPDLIAQLAQEGLIPVEGGRFLSFGDFEDTYANMGYCSVTPLLSAKRFVLSADISWASGNQTPTSIYSGCGVVFNAAGDSTDHLMVSRRMDGSMYISGAKGYNYLSYAKFPYANPSITGSTKLVLVVNGSEAAVYMDGQKKSHRHDLPVWGDVVGLAVLSGTYQDFGTRCIFRDVEIYTW